ncbi:MAG: MerR family transcriptional regulator, partial [Pseudomonadota bacterium]
RTLKTANSEQEQPKFRIGAVSKLTGVPVDTLRAWERRYQITTPTRSSSSARLYRDSDVEKLRTIKRLVSEGYAIGTLAPMSADELLALAEEHAEAPRGAEARTIRTLITYGDNELPIDHTVASDNGVEMLKQYRSWAAFEAAALESNPDAVVVCVAGLQPERVNALLSLVARLVARAVVIYGFAASGTLTRLTEAGVMPLRTPVSDELLFKMLAPVAEPAAPTIALPTSLPPRRFDEEALTQLAATPTVVECECPLHLVDIIRNLNNFEMYSAECLHRDDKDAEIHTMLRSVTANARAHFEQALIDVAEHEGIALPE